MNKSVKKILLFVVILIVAIMMISAVYLLLLEPGGNTSVTPSPSGAPSAPISPSPSESAAVQTETPSPADEGYTREETADGAIFHMTVPGNLLAYSVTVDEQVFSLKDTDGRMLFQSKSDESEFLELSFIEESTAAELAPSYLDSYLDYKEFEQSGENDIGTTEISGETIEVNDGKTQMEAWLVDTDNGVLAVVISYSLSDKDDAAARLEKMLDTLAIEP
jgi:hypothetical protein